MKALGLTLAASLLLFASTPAAHADVELRYSKSSPLTLGKNGVPALPETTYEECIVSSGVAIDSLLPTEDGKYPTSVDSLILTSDFSNTFEKIIRDLDIESHSEVSGTFGEGISGKLRSELDLRIDDTNTSDLSAFIVTGRYGFGSRSLKSPKLKPEIVDLINAGKIDEARTRCGTHYVRSQEQVAFVKIIISTSSISSNVSAELRNKFSANGDIGVFKLDGAAQLKYVHDELKKYGDVKISVVARGGDPTEAATLFGLTDPNKLIDLMPAVKKYLSSFSYANSVAGKRQLAEIPALVKFGAEGFYDDQLAFLRSVGLKARRLRISLNNLDRVLENNTLTRNLDGQKLAELTDRRTEIAVALGNLESRKKSCILDAAECRLGLISSNGKDSWSALNIEQKSIRLRCLNNEGTQTTSVIDVLADITFSDLNFVSDLTVVRRTLEGKDVKINLPDWKTTSDLSSNRSLFRIETVVPADEQVNWSYDLNVAGANGVDRWYRLGEPRFGKCN